MELSEAQIKKAVSDYLTILQNQGKLWFERLNSGSILAKKGDRVYKVQLCREGTADFIVIFYWHPLGAPNKGSVVVWFFEIKDNKGKQTPAQVDFQRLVETQYCHYAVIRSVDEIMWLED